MDAQSSVHNAERLLSEMAYEISEDLIEQVKLCHHGFSCLEEGRCDKLPMCEVEHAGDCGAFRVRLPAAISCPHLLVSDGGVTCHCPVRREIYRQYGD